MVSFEPSFHLIPAFLGYGRFYFLSLTELESPTAEPLSSLPLAVLFLNWL